MSHNHEERQEAARLFKLWQRAADKHDDEGSVATYEREERAWERLVEYVEAHNLNHTVFDPRPVQVRREK